MLLRFQKGKVIANDKTQKVLSLTIPKNNLTIFKVFFGFISCRKKGFTLKALTRKEIRQIIQKNVE